MKIKIEKIIYPGKSLAREKGKVIFSDQGLPDEDTSDDDEGESDYLDEDDDDIDDRFKGFEEMYGDDFEN